MAHLPYTVIFKKQLSYDHFPLFYLNSFIVHLYQPIHGNKQEATLYILDVHRVLAFYIEKDKIFLKVSKSLLSIMELSKGGTIFKQRLSKWISGCINFCYSHHRIQPPPGTCTHSIIAHATSIAFLNDVPVMDICKAATWVSAPTFTQHCHRGTLCIRHSTWPCSCGR